MNTAVVFQSVMNELWCTS